MMNAIVYVITICLCFAIKCHKDKSYCYLLLTILGCHWNKSKHTCTLGNIATKLRGTYFSGNAIMFRENRNKKREINFCRYLQSVYSFKQIRDYSKMVNIRFAEIWMKMCVNLNKTSVHKKSVSIKCKCVQRKQSKWKHHNRDHG